MWTVIYIVVIYLLVILPLGRFIGKRLKENSSNLPKDFNKLSKRLAQIPELKDRAEHMVWYHNQRIKAGADSKESYDRMIRDLERLLLEEKQDAESPEPDVL